MTNSDHDMKAALDKLEAFLDGQAKTPPDFTEEDITILKRVIVLVAGLEALGSFAGFIKTTIIWFGIIVGGFLAVKNGAIEFILSTVSGGK